MNKKQWKLFPKIKMETLFIGLSPDAAAQSSLLSFLISMIDGWRSTTADQQVQEPHGKYAPNMQMLLVHVQIFPYIISGMCVLFVCACLCANIGLWLF